MVRATGKGEHGSNSDPVEFSFSDPSDTANNGSGASGNVGTIDPASIDSGSGNSDGTGGSAGRVKRKYTKRGTAGKTAQVPNLDFISDLLLTIHAGIALRTGMEEFALDAEEAQKLASTSTELASHYGVQVNAKTQAWLRFVGAIGSVYGTRAIAIIAKTREERATPAPAQTQTDSGPAFLVVK